MSDFEENKNLTPEEIEAIEADETVETVSETTEAPVESTAEQDLKSQKASHQVKIMSPGRLVAKRFFRSRLSVVGLVILSALFLFAIFGPIFSPYGETEDCRVEKDVYTIYSYDATEYLTDGAGNPILDENGKQKTVTYTIYEERHQVTHGITHSSSKHWLGTDMYGFDVLTRLMYGGRISLSLSFIVVFLELFIGIVLGGIAGYFGKWVDNLIMRIVDILNCLPGLPLLLIGASVIKSFGVESKFQIFWLMGVLTIFSWGGIARLDRGQILMFREQEFMIATEATGLSAPRKIFKHLIPNVMPQLIVSATLGLGSTILYEATLSYLGLGVQFPFAAWGSMINMASPTTANGRIILQYYPEFWIPAGICIVLAVLGFNFVGDGLRDAFDPKAKR